MANGAVMQTATANDAVVHGSLPAPGSLATLSRRIGLAPEDRCWVAGEGRASVRRLAPLAGRARGGRGFCRALLFAVSVLPFLLLPCAVTSCWLHEVLKQKQHVQAEQDRLQDIFRQGAGDEAKNGWQQVLSSPQTPPPVLAARGQ